MVEVEGYRVEGVVHDGSRTRVYRGVAEATGQRVMIKVVNADVTDPHPAATLERAFMLAHDIRSSGVIRHLALAQGSAGVALITEDVGGVALSRLLEAGPMPLERGLRLAIGAAKALVGLHDAGLVHKDIKPDNLIVHPQTNMVHVIDLGIASRLNRELLEPVAPDRIEGTLSYLAPEQTGRLHRSVDQRADLYALGITLYEMLAGKLPFVSDDPMEIIHSHLAKRARPLREATIGQVPAGLSEVVERLMAKAADDRYASATGLVHDLEVCLDVLQRTGDIPAFKLGLQDGATRLAIPERLYGREEELEELERACARVSDGARELLLVAGFSGVGKSALVYESQRAIAQYRGWFCSGKFDQLRRDQPYVAWTAALRTLVQQVLTESQARVDRLRCVLIEVLGENAAALEAVLPELGLLLGAEPPPPATLGPGEEQARLARLLIRLLDSVAQTDRPIVLFLDDLQWADLGSLRLLEAVLDSGTLGHLLIVGGYRDYEVESSPVLADLLVRLKSDRGAHTMALGPLKAPHVQHLVADTLWRSREEVTQLSELIWEKTRGNPFFVSQLMLSLYESGDLYLERGQWSWRLERIAAADVGQDVAMLLAGRLQQLNDAAREVLAFAACIGASFHLSVLVKVSGLTQDVVVQALESALALGLILPIDARYKYVAVGTPARRAKNEATYRFAHDRIQQASYQLVDSETRAKQHGRIGRSLLEQHADPGAAENLIDIVDHLDHDLASAKAGPERRLLASLNLKAGQKAVRSLAFDTAHRYLGIATGLLGPSAAVDDPLLAFELYEASAHAAFHAGDLDTYHRRFDVAIGLAPTVLASVPLQLLAIRAELGAGGWAEGSARAISTLAALGVVMPAQPGKVAVVRELIAYRREMAGRPAAALVGLPEISDPRDEAIDELMLWLATCSYFGWPDLVPLTGLRMARLALKRGAGPNSAFGFAVVSLIQAGVLEQFEAAVQMADAADATLKRFNADGLVGKIGLITDGFVRPWRLSNREQVPALLERRVGALDVGDEEFGVYCGAAALHLDLHGGRPIAKLRERFELTVNFARHSRQVHAWPMIVCWWSFLSQLSDAALEKPVLWSEEFDWERDREELVAEGNGNSVAHASTAAAMLAFWFGDYASALADLEIGNRFIEGVVGQSVVLVQRVYHALAHLEAYKVPGIGVVARQRHWASARYYAFRARRLALANPEDSGHYAQWLDAESDAAQGRTAAALRSFQLALLSAQRAGRPQEEAIISERLGAVSMGAGLSDMGQHYLERARALWLRYGAFAKAAHVQRVWQLPSGRARLTTSDSSGDGGDSGLSSGLTSGAGADHLDLNGLLSAVQSLSREIGMESLIQRLLELVLRSAGAQRVVLMLWRDRALLVEGERHIDDTTGRAKHSVPVDQHGGVPLSVIDYVKRTREAVVVEDARQSEMFRRDPVVAERGVRSMMCLPLLLQGQDKGLLYLENDLVEGVFYRARRELLEALCAQAAVSLENARLYGSVAESLQRARESHDALSAALEQLRTSSVSVTRLEDILAGQRDAVLVFDENERVSFANAAAAELFGLAVPQLRGMQTSELLPRDPDDYGQPRGERWVRRTGRTAARVLVSRGVLGENDGSNTGIVVCLTDISFRQEAENALRQAREVADRASATKSRFLASMSHELRTPLNAILGYTDLIDEDLEQMAHAEVRADLGRVRTASRHLLGLIDDILDLSKIEAEKLDIILEDVPLSEIVEEVANHTHPLNVKNQNVFTVEISDAPPTVWADRVRLKQVLINLLGNAAKFTESGKVGLRVFTERERVCFSVSDTGIGMSEEQQTRLFEAFQQADASVSRRFGGTGLGLALSQRLAELQGGRIRVESEEGVGSVFTLELERYAPN